VRYIQAQSGYMALHGPVSAVAFFKANLANYGTPRAGRLNGRHEGFVGPTAAASHRANHTATIYGGITTSTACRYSGAPGIRTQITRGLNALALPIGLERLRAATGNRTRVFTVAR
jgi:hypothetical protein